MQWIWDFFLLLPAGGGLAGRGGGCHHDRMVEVKTSFLQKVVRRQAGNEALGAVHVGARVTMHVRAVLAALCVRPPELSGHRLCPQKQKQQREMRSHAAVQTPPWDLLCLPSAAVCNLHDLHTWRSQKLTHTGCRMICAAVFMIIMIMMSVPNPKHSRHSSSFSFFQRGTLWA